MYFSVKSAYQICTLPLKKWIPERYYSTISDWYRIRNDFDTEEWTAPLNPYKEVQISPSRINRMTPRTPNLPIEKRIEMFGRVLGGDWDRQSEMEFGSWRPERYGNNKWIYELLIDNRFNETVFYRSATKHVEDGVPWKETEFYNKMMAGFECNRAGLPAYGETCEEFLAVLREIDVLYDSIQQNGVRSQFKHTNKSFLRALNDSILVDIGRDGELLFVEGRRRLTMAKILDIDTVPVCIQIRHEDWMDYRDRVYRDGMHVSHPDFSEFKS